MPTRAADQLGYRPNPIARGLKTSRSYTIGVLIPDITNPLFPPIVRGIDDRLGPAGYTQLLVNTDNDAARERGQIETMLARQVDGFISATARLDVEPLAEAIAAAGGRWCSSTEASRTSSSLRRSLVDDAEGSRLAVEHVIGLGHERIGYVAGPQNVVHRPPPLPRLRRGDDRGRPGGALASTADAFARSVHRGGRRARVRRGARRRRRRPTAIVTANDRLAIGCYDTLGGLGLTCPGDISVVGFNDMLFIDRLRPPLTTVRVPQREVGFAAAGMLLEQLADADAAASDPDQTRSDADRARLNCTARTPARAA